MNQFPLTPQHPLLQYERKSTCQRFTSKRLTKSKMASDTAYTVEPTAAHTHTVIFLHGRDSNAKEFASELFESEASEPVDQPRTLPDLFPNIRWVFPSALTLHSKRFSTDMSQWFDMWSVEKPSERPELQHPGLHQSIKRILRVIKEEEETRVPRERIFLAGISQGFATAIAAFCGQYAEKIRWINRTMQLDASHNTRRRLSKIRGHGKYCNNIEPQYTYLYQSFSR